MYGWLLSSTLLSKKYRSFRRYAQLQRHPMQRIFHQMALVNHIRKINVQLDCQHPVMSAALFLGRSITYSCDLTSTSLRHSRSLITVETKKNYTPRFSEIRSILDENVEELSEDDELCPVDCVREFYTDDDFLRILEKSKESNALVVVDFYRTSCGSCRYIEQGFAKLCKGSGDQGAPVVFLKHNVIDEYDEESEVADRLRIRSVPLFHFYKNGVLLEAFPTRDKERILGAILKYTSPASQEVA
ncbi:thioredoxin-like 4, chloroplastic isoform X1 [Primulina eburnea]|uniref:thioredoxin-like 4, chloroplastic isoform X1 n=2 Tax=Primulina eburnea TaxID=1245227 RepID=UPI003C6C6885